MHFTRFSVWLIRSLFSGIHTILMPTLETFSVRFRLKSGKICKNNDHTCLFHCITNCRVTWTMFEHKAFVQTSSSDPANVNT